MDSEAVIEEGAVVGNKAGDRDHITLVPSGARVTAVRNADTEAEVDLGKEVARRPRLIKEGGLP